MNAKRFGVLCVGLVCTLLSFGCQSASAPAASSQMSMGKEILATSGNGTYTLFIPSSDGSVTTMSSANTPVCKECQADAIAYYKTGKIDPVCSVCGAHRVVLEPSETIGSPGHQ